MSQRNDDFNIIINFFKTGISKHNEFLLDEDGDEQVDSNDSNDDELIRHHLDKLFSMNNLTIEKLSNILNSNLISYFYCKIKKLANFLSCNDDDEAKKVLIDLISYIESFFECIDTNQQIVFKFECFASFFIFTLKLNYVLFDMMQQMAPDNEISSQFISSQISSSNCLNKFNVDLTNKLNGIMKKLSLIVERKMTGFDETTSKSAQIKLIHFVVKLITNFRYENKTLAFVWRLITKIVIKHRLFLDANPNDMTVMNSFSSSNQTVKSLVNKLFYTIYKANYLVLLKIKIALDKVVNDKEGKEAINSNSLKFSGFLFKILKSIVCIYFTWLNDSELFYLMTNLFGIVSFILLLEAEPVLDSDDSDLDYMQNHRQIKLELSKELSISLEELIGLFSKSTEYVAYMIETDLNQLINLKNESMNKFKNDYHLNEIVKIDCYEELVLFYSIFLNKCGQTTSPMTSLQIKGTNIKLLNNIFELINLSLRACNLPIHVISVEVFKNEFINLNELSSKSDYFLMEFYEFIQMNVLNYVFNMLAETPGLDKTFISYLINNLITEHETIKSKRVILSHDVLVLLTKQIVMQSDYAFKLFQYMFEIFEYLKRSHKMYSYQYYGNCLNELIVYYNTKFENGCLPKLLDHLREQKFYSSYSFVFSLIESNKQLSTTNESIFSSSKMLENYSHFNNELSKFVEKVKAVDQNFIKKLVTYIQNKDGFQQIYFIDCFLTQNNISSLSSSLIEQASKSLINLFRLDFIDNFLKYFENVLSHNDSSRMPVEIYSNVRYVFNFIFKSINIWSELSSISLFESDKIRLVEFLNKYSFKKISIDSNKFRKVILNFKFQLLYSLELILSKEIKDNSLRKKITNVMFNLANDTNPIVAILLIKVLSDIASYDHVNNKILSVTIRANSKIRELMATDKIEECDSKTEELLLVEKSEARILQVLKGFKNIDNQENNELDFASNSKAPLDDTMAAILMDTTIINSQTAIINRINTEKLIEQIERDLNAVFASYDDADYPLWLKERLNLLFKTYSDKLFI